MLGGARSTVSDGASSDAPTGTLNTQFPTYRGTTLGVATLDPRAFRIFQRQLQLAGKRLDGCPRSLPGALALESQVTDPAPPGSNHPADGAEISPVRMLLIEPADDVGRHADKCPQGRRRLDAVLAPVPGRPEDHGDL